MESLFEDLHEDILNKSERNVQTWAELVSRLGPTTEERAKWINIFKQSISQTFNDIVEDVKEKQTLLSDEIDELLKKMFILCKILQEPLPAYGEKQNLYMERNILRKSVEQFETEIKERKLKLRKLQKTAIKLCSRLGKDCKNFDEELFLSKDNMLKYVDDIKEMEMLEFTRIETYIKSKENIVNLIHELKYRPNGQFEEAVYTNTDDVLITDDDMKKLENLNQKLIIAKTKLQEAVNNTRQKIQEVAVTLGEDIHETNQFLARHNSYTYQCLDLLKNKLNHLHELQLYNMQTLISKLQIEIKDLSEKCYYTEEQTWEFQHIHYHNLTEEILLLHEKQLENLKKHYAANQNIFNLLAERDVHCAKLCSLQNNRLNAHKFTNRGAQLLQEENTRKEILKVEHELLELTARYEAANGRAFLMRGRTVQEIIKAAREQRNNEKIATKRKIEELPPSNGNKRAKLGTDVVKPSTSMRMLAAKNDNKCIGINKLNQ